MHGAQSSFAHLLCPGRIGTLETRNRIVMAPMGSNLADANGYVGERLTRYYEARARGGVGLIIVGVGAIAFPNGACIPHQVAISDDVFVPGLRQLTARVHAHGAKIAIQLQHAGKVATEDMAAGRPVWVPSVPSITAGDLLNDLTQAEVQGVVGHLMKPGAGLRFHAMTAEDIPILIAMFADAADRARRAGFDGVEIHGAHGYLLAAFLSPAANRRTDAYGGALENRARLLVEVLQAVRERVGSNFPVWCRLDGREFRIEDGITVEDAERTAVLAEAAGADAIHVSAYADPTSGAAFTEAPLVHQPCGYVGMAERIKRRVHIPIIAVGRIEPEDAASLIETGKADFVAMARKLLADPELPNKLVAGRRSDVRPCVYCYTCVGNIYLHRSVACAVNPATGREAAFAVIPPARPKRILIAGGGPAGLEAARVAALRGHEVTLCEKEERLGGAACLSSLLYEANGKLVEFLEAQVREVGVDLHLGQEVTPALVAALRPDTVLVAVGAEYRLPEISGAERASMVSAETLRRLLGGHPQRIVILGGGLIGLELAEALCERGRAVTVLEERATLGVEMALPRRWRALDRLRTRGAQLCTSVRIDAITDGGVRCSENGEERIVPADAVVIAEGRAVRRGLAAALDGLVSEIHLVGDCNQVGYLEGALIDAARVAGAI